jgi:hypothetical protein
VIYIFDPNWAVNNSNTSVGNSNSDFGANGTDPAPVPDVSYLSLPYNDECYDRVVMVQVTPTSDSSDSLVLELETVNFSDSGSSFA